MYHIICKLELDGREELRKITLHLYRGNVPVRLCNVSKQINNLSDISMLLRPIIQILLKVNHFNSSLFELNLHLEHV